MRGWLPRTGAVMGLVLLAGCSPYLYGNEIGKFADASTALAQATAAARNDGAERYRNRTWQALRPEIAAGNAIVGLHPSCTGGALGAAPPLPAGQSCGLVVTRRGAGGAPAAAVFATDPNAAAYGQAVKAAHALEIYAAALKAITDASDRQHLDEATAGLCAAAASLAAAATFAIPPAAAIAPVQNAVCALVGQATGATLDMARYRALRRGVEEAQATVIPRFATYLGEVLAQMKINRIALLREEARRSGQALRAGASSWPGTPTAFDDRSARLSTIAAEISMLQGVDPADTVSAMAAAHQALAEALGDERRQFNALSNAVGKFASEAQKLRKAITALTDDDD